MNRLFHLFALCAVFTPINALRMNIDKCKVCYSVTDTVKYYHTEIEHDVSTFVTKRICKNNNDCEYFVDFVISELISELSNRNICDKLNLCDVYRGNHEEECDTIVDTIMEQKIIVEKLDNICGFDCSEDIGKIIKNVVCKNIMN